MNTITLDATSPTVRYGMSAGEFRRVTAIFASVILATGVSKESIFGRRRTARVAHARQLAMTLVRETTDLSLMEVGDIFGRDHGTVIHAIRAVAARRATDGEFDALYLSLIAQAKA